ncbi:MAG: hypothetical protein JRC93_04095 [Deltaproteobacteria bacterium]|nr:hypothetical protein [Deltaproteobacteria bacterium]
MSDITDLTRILSDPTQSSHRRIIAGDVLRYALVQDEAIEEAEQIASEVITLGRAFLGTDGNKTEQMEVYDALERAYITRAPNNFHDYMIALEWKRPAHARFYQPRMSVLRHVVDALTDLMVKDLYDIVLFSMPVRVGKSALGLFFISWVAGRNPDDPILATGYAETITKMFHTGLTAIYEDPNYNYHEIFPKLDLVNTSAKDLTLDFRDDGKKSVRKYKTITCRAIDGSLTGATEARQLLYCDDLVRDIEEALNPNRLQILRDKLVTNVYSRKKEGCKELHIGTRWSIHDPIGWVERMHEDNPRCKVIRMPALDLETDESNFQYSYGIGFSTEYYREVRRLEDEVTWQCVYQQQPIERAGLLFPADELIYCYDIPDIEAHPPDDIFAFCDVAFGGNDFLSMPIAYQWGDDPPVIADAIFLKGGYKLTEPMVAGSLVNRKVVRAVFEANNGGDFYSRDVDALVKETDHKMFITNMLAKSNKSKETRIIQHSPAIRSFTFLHPDAGSPMYRAFITGLTTYTVNGKNFNDDAPDSLAGLAAMMRCSLNATITLFDRTHI